MRLPRQDRKRGYEETTGLETTTRKEHLAFFAAPVYVVDESKPVRVSVPFLYDFGTYLVQVVGTQIGWPGGNWEHEALRR
ncbi:MAG: hypothetical protein WCG80_00140 [Spirochaetales bacterium]